MSLRNLLATPLVRRDRLAQEARAEAAEICHAAQRSAFGKTMEEVNVGRMGATMTKPEVMQRHGNFWNCTWRSAIQQGTEADGGIRFCAIDGHNAS